MSNRAITIASRNKWALAGAAVLLAFGAENVQAVADQVPAGMSLIPAGTYSPFFAQKSAKASGAPAKTKPVYVDAFWLDNYPVTNRQFLDFVRRHATWRKSQAKAVFADPHYLDHWQSDLRWQASQNGSQPVTNISWFAAEAYCESLGKSLPTTGQWEYALADQGRDKNQVRDKALAWYSSPDPASLPAVGSTGKNGFGIYDMVGLVWEWTQDFNSFMAGAELRDSDGKDRSLFCGNGSSGVKDASDYAAFMRFSLRTSIKASYTTNNLGFRCAKEHP